MFSIAIAQNFLYVLSYFSGVESQMTHLKSSSTSSISMKMCLVICFIKSAKHAHYKSKVMSSNVLFQPTSTIQNLKIFSSFERSLKKKQRELTFKKQEPIHFFAIFTLKITYFSINYQSYCQQIFCHCVL